MTYARYAEAGGWPDSRTCASSRTGWSSRRDGARAKMTRLRGRVLRRKRLRKPFGHGKTQTIIAGLRNDNLVMPASGKPATRCTTAASMLPTTTIDPLEFEDCPSALECTNDFTLDR